MAAIGSLLAVTEVTPDGNLADQIQSHPKLICQETAQISHMFDQMLNKPMLDCALQRAVTDVRK
jgi:hypothetical protein